MKGLGDQVEKILSGYMDRAAAGLIQLVTEEQRLFAVTFRGRLRDKCGTRTNLPGFAASRRTSDLRFFW